MSGSDPGVGGAGGAGGPGGEGGAGGPRTTPDVQLEDEAGGPDVFLRWQGGAEAGSVLKFQAAHEESA